MTNPKVSDERVQQYATEELCEAHGIGVRCGVCDGILMARELLTLRSENERQWISVEERLPEGGGTYLIARENKPFPMAVYLAHFVRFESGPVWSFDRHFKAVDAPNIKYWQPLPTPPAPGPTSTEEKADGKTSE